MLPSDPGMRVQPKNRHVHDWHATVKRPKLPGKIFFVRLPGRSGTGFLALTAGILTDKDFDVVHCAWADNGARDVVVAIDVLVEALTDVRERGWTKPHGCVR